MTAKEFDAMIDRMALAIRNTEATERGWPDIKSLSEIEDQDADSYRRIARAAYAAQQK